MAEEHVVVIGGVDTHKDTHVAAVIDTVGRLLGTANFAANRVGYEELTVWMGSFGYLERVGVEGTGSYGAGLARHLADAAVTVVEVNGPNRQMRRARGKNDTINAEAAARAALNGYASATPKTRDGLVESIRVLRIAFRSARSTRARVALQLRDLVVCAPPALREALEPLTTPQRVRQAARFRSGPVTDPTQATREAMRSLARRYQALTAEISKLRGQLDELTGQANPALRAAKGVGADVASILLIAAGDNPERLRSEAAFAAMSGVSPIEASSGLTTRHRLNRGGNRQANHALWRIAMVRLATDPDHVRNTLTDAAIVARLDEHETAATITSGLTAGQRQPRTVPTSRTSPTPKRQTPADAIPVGPALRPARTGPVELHRHGTHGWRRTVTHNNQPVVWRTGTDGHGLYTLTPGPNSHWRDVHTRQAFELPPERRSAYQAIIRGFTARPPRTRHTTVPGAAVTDNQPHTSALPMNLCDTHPVIDALASPATSTLARR